MSEDDDHKRICPDCVGEAYLAQQIDKDGQCGDCSYCGQTLACIPISELADHIETAFADHYVRTANYPDSWQERAMADRESSYEWERDGQPVLDAIQEAASIPGDAAADVLEILDNRHGDLDSAAMGEETEFSGETYYEEKGASAQAWHEEWHSFEQSLKTEARFFSRSATELLARVFGQIDTLKTKPRRPLVVDAGPNRKLTHLYRARVFQSTERLEEALCRPDLHLGSPPTRLASAGRMNARGISVFMGGPAPRSPSPRCVRPSEAKSQSRNSTSSGPCVFWTSPRLMVSKTAAASSTAASEVGSNGSRSCGPSVSA